MFFRFCNCSCVRCRYYLMNVLLTVRSCFSVVWPRDLLSMTVINDVSSSSFSKLIPLQSSPFNRYLYSVKFLCIMCLYLVKYWCAQRSARQPVAMYVLFHCGVLPLRKLLCFRCNRNNMTKFPVFCYHQA